MRVSAFLAVVCLLLFHLDAQAQAALDLYTLDGSNGFKVTGQEGGDQSSRGVGSGDINNDGIDDLVIGAPFARLGATLDVGKVYVVFGTDQGFDAAFDLDALNGTNGFAIAGVIRNDEIGKVVAVADVNGDQFDDVIMGGTGGDGALARGRTYIVYGSASPFPASFLLSALDGTNGFSIGGLDPQDGSGGTLAAGDINDDSVDDLIIAATGGDPDGVLGGGEVYVVFGNVSGFGLEFDLATLDGTNGFTLTGTGTNDFTGGRLASGDVNGDGIDDVIVSAFSATVGGFFGAGKVYTFFGSDTGFAASTSLSALDGTNGFLVQGGENNFTAGGALAAGDLNNDGIDDLVIGANANATVDTTYVILGRNTAWPASSVLWSTSSVVGSVITGDADIPPYQRQLGSALAFGDLNDDSIDDLIVGSPGFSGSAYTYAFLGRSGWPATIAVSELDGTNGFVMRGFGSGANATRVASGDIDGDGSDDVIIGDPLWDIDPFSTAGNDGGESYVVFSDLQGSVSNESLYPAPRSGEVSQNYPNPFNAGTTITYDLPRGVEVSLKVFDVLGREVAQLASGPRPAGTHEVSFDARYLLPGIYFYRLHAGDYVETKRMVVVR